MKTLMKELSSRYGEAAAEKVESVLAVVQAKIVARNLFGWRAYIDEMLVDLIGYMIATDFEYSGGAYVACGMQSAIDHSRYCSAQKRRARFCSEVSLQDVEYSIQVDISGGTQAADFVEDIKAKFGAEVAETLKPFVLGVTDEISAEVVKKCKTEEFRRWLENYREQ